MTKKMNWLQRNETSVDKTLKSTNEVRLIEGSG